MGVLPIAIAIAVWPMTFVVRRWRYSSTGAVIGVLLSAFFLISAFVSPEHRYLCLLFALCHSL